MPRKLIIALSFALSILLTAQEKPADTSQAQPSDTSQASTTQAQKKAGGLTGTVLRSDTKAPIRNARVTLVATGAEQDADASPRSQTVTTDDKGRFEFAHLEAGSYYLSADHPGMVLKQRQRHENMLVSVKEGEQQEIALAMQPSCVITGRVLDEQGEPLQDVSISALRYAYTIAGRRPTDTARATTDDKGEYRLFGLAPGSYLVQADVGGGSGGWFFRMSNGTDKGATRGSKKKEESVYAPTYYPNESSPEQATAIVLKPGEETEANFSLARVPAHHILGKVTGFPATGDDDKGKTQRMVMAVRQGSQMPVGMGLVNPDSSFDVGPLPAGKYKLVAFQIQEESRVSGTTEAVLGSSDVSGVNIAVNAATRKITGVIHKDGDAKVDYSKLYVVLLPENLDEFAANTGGNFNLVDGLSSAAGFAEVKKDGTFTIDLVPTGEVYRVALSANGGGLEDWFTSKVLVGGQDVLEQGLKITQAMGPIEIMISNNAATVEGTALDADKKPFANAEVLALPADSKLRKRFDLIQKTEADQQGRFKLRGVRPGEYLIMALEDAQEQPFLQDEFLKQHSGEMQKLTLEAGKSQRVELKTIAVEGK